MNKHNLISYAKTFVFITIKCIIVFFLLFICRLLILQDNYFSFFFASFLIAIPLSIFSCAKTIIHKEHTIKHYEPNTIFCRFVSKRWFSYIINITISCLLAIILSIFIATLSKAETLASLTTLLSILILHLLILKLTKSIFKEEYREYRSSFLQDLLVITVGAFLYSFLVCIFGGVHPIHTEEFTVNKIAFLIDGIMEGINTVTYALLNNDLVKEFSSPIYLAVAIFALQGGILFYSLSRVFLCCFLPAKRIKSIFYPISVEKNIKHSKLQSSQTIIFFISLLVIFTGLQFCLYKICTYKNLAKITIDKTTLITEKVENEVYRIGTSAKCILLEETFTAETKEELENEVNNYFDEMEENVDKYLDWYYSLKREYSELGTYVIGIIEDQVEEKAVEYINKHLTEKLSPNYDLDTKLEKIINYKYKEFQKAKELLFKENRINNPSKTFSVPIKTKFTDIVEKTEKPQFFISGTKKFTISVTGGIIVGVTTGIATKKIIKKLSTKMSQKAATKVVTKVATTATKKGISKTVGGAISGAAVGSIAGPVGAVMGTVAGVLAPLAIEKIFIEFDEYKNRESYKQDILNCIQEERQNYLNIIASL